ncbi:MAG: EVE domain-containing protein, partial [Actinomycetota bacterium]|nr:EVE domain-containing protein [Actinomycetota bacterium]
MNNWVMSFVGDYAWDNFEAVRRGCIFHISSNRTPVRKALPGDQALFYMAGEGFVGAAEVSEAAAAPGEAPDWSSKNPPLWAIPVTRMRAFPESVPYTFPKD